MKAEKKKTISLDTIGIIVAVLLILVYVIFECYSVSHIELETQTAVTSTIYETIDATALVIRDEHSLPQAQNSITVPSLSDGDKINVGGTVALTFPSQEDASAYSKLNELQSELSYYEGLEAQTVGQAASVEAINAEINNDVDSYIQAIATGDVEKINSYGDRVNDVLLRRQMIIGQSVDLLSVIQNLRSEISSVSAKPNSTLTTDKSGVFSSYVDGYEAEFDYSKAKDMSIEEIEGAIEKAKQKNDTSASYGKLITSYTWYLECVIDTDLVKGLENGNKVSVTFKDNSDRVLTCKIVDGAEPDLGQEKTALILKCNNMNSDLASLRVEDIEIRVKKYEGIKVPASALHVVDGKKGVYALISSQVKFREASVVYSNGDYLLLSYDADNKDGIHMYDKIILQGKDLEDGRVYT